MVSMASQNVVVWQQGCGMVEVSLSHGDRRECKFFFQICEAAVPLELHIQIMEQQLNSLFFCQGLCSLRVFCIHIAESNKNRKQQPTKCPEKKIGLSYCPNSGRKDDGDLHTMKIKIALGRFFMEMDGKSCDFTQAGPDSRSLFFFVSPEKKLRRD